MYAFISISYICEITNQCIFLALIFPVVLAIMKFPPTRFFPPSFCDVIFDMEVPSSITKILRHVLAIYLQLMIFFCIRVIRHKRCIIITDHHVC